MVDGVVFAFGLMEDFGLAFGIGVEDWICLRLNLPDAKLCWSCLTGLSSSSSDDGLLLMSVGILGSCILRNFLGCCVGW